MRLHVAGSWPPRSSPMLGAMVAVLAAECWFSARCAPRRVADAVGGMEGEAGCERTP